MRRFLIVLMLLFVSTGIAQTTLSPGDLMMVTVNADDAKNFDFVPLVDLEAGTVIKFTDDGWDEGDVFRGSEGIVTYTAAAPVTAGTVVSFSGTVGGEFSGGISFDLSGSGDNILVYQGAEANPTFIYGIGWAVGTPWIDAGAATANNSHIPPGLSESEYTIVTLSTADNYQYNTANGTTANAVDLLALISDLNNWNGDDGTAYPGLVATFTITSANNLASHLVIAEIYPGGNNSGATYRNDYVVLYNPTGSSVDVSNFSVQYNSATNLWTSVSKINLTGSIDAGGYYLIQGSGGTSNGAPIPVTPNVSGTMNLAGAGGKVALVSNQVNISGSDDPDVVDFLGYGNANQQEGTVAPSLGNNTSSLRRKDNDGYKTYGTNGSGYDTDDNYFDFYVETDIATNQPLPVELTSFTANVFDGKVNLRWATATEVDNYGFEVQRSAFSNQRSANWETIGFVEGHGNSNSPKNYEFTDSELPNCDAVSYRLKQIDIDGAYEYSNEIEVTLETIPAKFELSQNYPNPFNPVTKIQYSIPAVIASEAKQSVNATLKVYDIIGREVAVLVNEAKEAGIYEVEFDASKLSSGLYFYSLSTSGKTITKKMMLLR